MEMTHRRRIGGVTLVELMIVLVVVSILIALAAPSFRDQIMKSRILAASESVTTAFNLARSEALKRKSSVSVCASSDGANCAGDWNQGFIVFVDSAGERDNAPILGTVLQVYEGFNGDVQINSNKTFIRYIASGGIGRVDDVAPILSVAMTGCSGNSARQIGVSLSGSIAVNPKSC